MLAINYSMDATVSYGPQSYVDLAGVAITDVNVNI
jgi:hypothetical protein